MDDNKPCIYKVTNNINNKVYIGRTINFHRRMHEHKNHMYKDYSLLHEDMKVYGFENFTFEIICVLPEEELDDAEKMYIKKYRDELGDENVYNICKGGIGGQTHDITGENNPMYGKDVSQERREHLSKMLKVRKKPDGFGEKLSKALTGKKKSPEQVAKKSHPISVYDILTGETLNFPSKAEMQRVLHCNTATLVNGGIAHNRYKLADTNLEDVETIESCSLN